MLLLLSVAAFDLLSYSECIFFKEGSESSVNVEPLEPVADVRLFLLGKRADINRATMEELVLVPGIGERLAQSVLDFREDVGFIFDVNELLIPFGPLNSRAIAILKEYFDTPFMEYSVQDYKEKADGSESRCKCNSNGG